MNDNHNNNHNDGGKDRSTRTPTTQTTAAAPTAGDSSRQAGDIVVAQAATGELRLVCITRPATTDAPEDTCDALLVTNADDMATPYDMICDTEHSGCAYRIVIQAELYGPLCNAQLQRTVGHIDGHRTAALRGALTSDGETLDTYKAGMPLGDTRDPRRKFKHNELGEWVTFVGPARQRRQQLSNTR